MIIHKRLKITGEVQGVFYRATAVQQAKELNLRGWIRNDEEGSVTASVQGEEEKINEFIEWCRQGSPMAKVNHVDEEECEIENFKGFEIKR